MLKGKILSHLLGKHEKQQVCRHSLVKGSCYSLDHCYQSTCETNITLVSLQNSPTSAHPRSRSVPSPCAMNNSKKVDWRHRVTQQSSNVSSTISSDDSVFVSTPRSKRTRRRKRRARPGDLPLARTGSLDSCSSNNSFIRQLACSPSKTRTSALARPLDLTPSLENISRSPSPRPSPRPRPTPSPCRSRQNSRPRSPRLSRSPSPHPVKNQRCSSQPSHMSAAVTNFRKRSLSGVRACGDRMRSMRSSIKRLSPRPSIIKTPTPPSSTSPVSQSRNTSLNTSPRTPGRVQFSPSASRKSSVSPKYFRTPSPLLSPVPPVHKSYGRCSSQPQHMTQSNLQTLASRKKRKRSLAGLKNSFPGRKTSNFLEPPGICHSY